MVKQRFAGTFAECKEQQLVFLLVRQLALAQFQLANTAMTARLWQEVVALDIDPERVTALLYGGQDVTDVNTLRDLDDGWRERHQPIRRHGWLMRPSGAWRQNAPRAAFRAHQPVG
jgi:hypothetical protein